jgi:hypothetical protein
MFNFSPKFYKVFMLRSLTIGLSIVFMGVWTSCEKKAIDHADKGEGFVRLDYDVTALDTLDVFTEGEARGLPGNRAIVEASGLAVSRVNPQWIWTHNDKGDANRLFLMDDKAEDLGFFWIRGTGNRDWEDMCIGPGPKENVNYVYIGDIGDNDAVYPHVIINRFPEPDLYNFTFPGIFEIADSLVERLVMMYPDGPRDAEALMIDPWTKDLYIITKREQYSSLYVARFPYNSSEVTMLKKIAEFPFNRALAGDISRDGTSIVVKTDRRLYYWKREISEDVLTALKRKPMLLPYIMEPQGEAFAWTPDGNGYFTLSEKSGVVISPLYFYQKK